MSLRETIDRLRSAPVPASEEAAKFQIIGPVLKALGWDPARHEDVLFEHTVGGNKGGRVDIALNGPDHIVALVEAKAPSQDLNKHVDQVIQYAFHEGTDICVLTTGFEWWLYLPREAGPPSKRRFATLSIRNDPIEQLTHDFLTFLGKDNLLSNQAVHRAQRILQALRDADRLKTIIPRVWKQMLAEPDKDLLEIVRKRVHEESRLQPSTGQVAAVLCGLPIPAATSGPSDVNTNDEENPERPSGNPPQPPKLALIERQEQATGRRARAFELWGHRYEVDNWPDLLARLAELLHQRHGVGFEQILELSGNRKVPAVTRDSGLLRKSRQVGSSGIFLNAAFTARTGFGRAHQFLEHFDHPTSDIRIWAEPATPRPRKPGSAPRAPASKPTGIRLWGETYSISAWRDIPIQVALCLMQRHGDSFERILELRGRIRPFATLDPGELRSSAQVGESEFYIDVNLSSKDCVRRAHLFLSHFGHPQSDLELLTEPGSTTT